MRYQILSRARELIADRKSWTQKSWAKDKYGVSTQPESSAAVCFCSLGAIYKATLEFGAVQKYEFEAKDALQHQMHMTVIRFNDSHTHREVLEKFDAALLELADECRSGLTPPSP